MLKLFSFPLPDIARNRPVDRICTDLNLQIVVLPEEENDVPMESVNESQNV